MPLRLYDTASRTVRPLEPAEPGHLRLYVCGPTVQAEPHVGHARSAIVFDVLRRWLEHGGTRVTLARNVTDVDDKIINVARESGEPWWALAERNTRAFDAAYRALGVLPPTVEPRATGHVTQMVELVERLLAAGSAYVGDGGDVWFAVSSLPGYGALSGQQPDRMEAAEDARGKRDPRDFALWKGAKEGEPSWPTPWGHGRPGWHLECSAMSTAYLGASFDLHGGGLDLVFPHHENERAQSLAAGDGFAAHWAHNGLVNVGAEKMSKSLGNSLLVTDLLRQVKPVALRYYLAAPHYRSTLDWTEAGLQESQAALDRITGFLERAGDPSPEADALPVPSAFADALPVPSAFADAMDDDLATPRAVAVLHDTVRRGNAALAAGEPAEELAREVRGMCAVLGLDVAPDPGGARLRPVVDALVGLALEQRAQARERRDWAAADAVRDRLAAAGVSVEDTPEGPRWTV